MNHLESRAFICNPFLIAKLHVLVKVTHEKKIRLTRKEKYSKSNSKTVEKTDLKTIGIFSSLFIVM